MKHEMITLKYGDFKVKLPRVKLAELAVSTLFSQVFPAFAPVIPVPIGGIPALGAVWPGEGGVNAGLVRGHDGHRNYYLIVSTGDDLGELEYGARGTEVEGADSAWDGLANTQALLASGKDCPAAKAAAGLTCDGRSDYYLPARRELQIAEANAPEVFAKGYHWSSTQRSASYAFTMNFDDGFQGLNDKGSELRVRPVRRLFI